MDLLVACQEIHMQHLQRGSAGSSGRIPCISYVQMGTKSCLGYSVELSLDGGTAPGGFAWKGWQYPMGTNQQISLRSAACSPSHRITQEGRCLVRWWRQRDRGSWSLGVLCRCRFPVTPRADCLMCLCFFSPLMKIVLSLSKMRRELQRAKPYWSFAFQPCWGCCAKCCRDTGAQGEGRVVCLI